LSGIPRRFRISLFFPLTKRIIGRIVRAQIGIEDNSDSILITQCLDNNKDYSGYAGVLLENEIGSVRHSMTLPAAFGVIDPSHTLKEGDIIAIESSGMVHVLYRRRSSHNALFVTGRCNSNCIMCSQPPSESDDLELLKDNLKIIELADISTNTLGITGGEPTLLKEDRLNLIAYSNQHLPRTHLHLLTNGRLLQNAAYVGKMAAVTSSNLTVAVPLYSDIDNEHDYIVQTRNGFNQTVQGILNLARYNIPIEVRIVIHKLNYLRLPQLAEFIYRNLTFTSHVALMALEPTGSAADNISVLWVDPFDYSAQLREAARYLAMRGMNVSIYNHQLCGVTEDIRSLCRQSISDWKIAFLPFCDSCASRNRCCGFFDSALPKISQRAH
jgi:His-Xaa-Ser system radical SAM maturase HxsC